MAQVMKFDVNDKNGIILATKNKYCTQDLKVVPKLKGAVFTENGDHPVPEGFAGYGDVSVNVRPPLEIVNITEGGTYAKTPSKNAYGISEVAVDIPLEQGNISSNGFYRPVKGKYFDSVNVDVKFDSLFPIQEQLVYTDDLCVPFSDFGVSFDPFYLTSSANDYVDDLLQALARLGVTIMGKVSTSDDCSWGCQGHYEGEIYYARPQVLWWVKGYNTTTTMSDYTYIDHLELVFSSVGDYYVFVNGEPRVKYTVVREG